MGRQTAAQRRTWTKRKIEDMSDNETNTNETTTTAPKEPKARKNSLPREEVEAILEGIPSFDKKAFVIRGLEQARGVRLAVASTKNVGRVYFYGDDDYSTLDGVAGVLVYDRDDRRENRRGGVMAEIDFSLGADSARAALVALAGVVRSAPAKAPRPERKPKAAKADAGTTVDIPPTATDAETDFASTEA